MDSVIAKTILAENTKIPGKRPLKRLLRLFLREDKPPLKLKRDDGQPNGVGILQLSNHSILSGAIKKEAPIAGCLLLGANDYFFAALTALS